MEKHKNNPYKQGFEQKQGYASGKTTDGSLRVLVLSIIERQPGGYTPQSIVRLLHEKSPDETQINEKTAGIILNDIMKGLRGSEKYSMRCERTARAGKTRAWLYILSERK